VYCRHTYVPEDEKDPDMAAVKSSEIEATLASAMCVYLMTTNDETQCFYTVTCHRHLLGEIISV
jgi:hypothetical protein